MFIIKAASHTLQHYQYAHKVARLTPPSELNLSVSLIYLNSLKLKLIPYIYTWGVSTLLCSGTGTILFLGTGTIPVPLALVLFRSVLTNLSNTKPSHNKTHYIITYSTVL